MLNENDILIMKENVTPHEWDTYYKHIYNVLLKNKLKTNENNNRKSER